MTTGCCEWPIERRAENIMDLERADSNIEIARVKIADADVKIVRASNYVKVRYLFIYLYHLHVRYYL